MASEIRANSITSRAGLSTVTMTDSGPMFSGITTFVDNSGFTFGVGGGTSIFTPATNILTLGTNNTEKVRIDANGNANITGVTTATNFKTGVSNLHNAGLTLSGGQIDVGSNIKIGTAGVVTATSFVGSGANLTGIPAQATIANNADNRVITGGSGVNLNGESGLLFTGTNLGIGNRTSSPDQLLHVHTSSGDAVIHVEAGADPKLRLRAHSGESIIQFADASSSNIGEINYVHSGDYLKFHVNASERLRITSAGDILFLGGTLRIKDSGNSAQRGAIYGDASSFHINAGVNNLIAYSAGTERLRIASNGTVSIGQAGYTQGGAAPLLSLYGSTGRAFKIMNSGTGTSGMQMQNSNTGYGEDAGIQFACLSGGSAYLVNQTNNVDFMVMYTKVSGSTKHIMQIYNDGKIGHQTNSDNLMLSNSQDGNGSNYFLRGSKNSTTPGGGNDCVWIYEDGDLRNNNNSYGQQSDIKLKENVVDAGSQWDDIKNLKVRKFNFKASTGFDTHTQIGLIAQEAELVSPGLVKEVKDRVKTEEVSEVDGSTSYKESLSETEKTKHVMYSVLYMKAIKALQEAMTRIETLEQDNIALRARVTNLEDN